MRLLLSLLISAICIVGSIFHLHQSADTYFDAVAFFVVLGGTLSVAVMTFPWESYRDIFRGIGSLMLPHRDRSRWLGQVSISFIQAAHRNAPPEIPLKSGLFGQVLRDGAELISLGFATAKIEDILQERIHHACERARRVANSFRGLSKYPPAFGLVGTVLTLVSLMRAISAGASSQEAGTRMAVALVATLYGLLVANLFINPAGERILAMANEERGEAEFALQAVLLAADRTSLLEAQELLNSRLPARDRIDLLRPVTASRSGEAA